MLTISKTEAVNRIMQALDGTIVSDITDPQNDTILQAIRAIDLATEKIQIENEWNFNMDGPRTLLSNNDGEILVPEDFIYIKFLNWSNGIVRWLSVKEGKVYNKETASTQVTGSVEIVGSRKFDYDELPASIQNYVIEKAKYEFVGLHNHLSSPRIAIYDREMKDAYTAAMKWDAQQQFGTMDFGPSSRNTLKNRGARGGWWWG